MKKPRRSRHQKVLERGPGEEPFSKGFPTVSERLPYSVRKSIVSLIIVCIQKNVDGRR